MGIAADVEGVVLENASATLLARVLGPDNETPIVQGDLTSAKYTAYLLDDNDPDVQAAVTGHVDVDMPVASLIYNTLQTDALWSVDEVGYNLKWILDVLTNPLFELIGRRYRIRMELTPTSGQKIVVRFRVRVE